MKLVFERDIPALQGRTWQERTALRKLARTRDRRIALRSFLISLPGTLLLPGLMELRKHQFLPSLLWVALIYFTLSILLGLLAHARWVTPLVEAALRQPPPPDHPLRRTGKAGEATREFDY